MPKYEQHEKGKAIRSRGPETGERQVVWEDTGLQSVYANATHVVGSRAEIVLRFGMSRGVGSSSGEKAIHWAEAIALSPGVAKRLAVILDRVVSQYERRFGSLDPGAPSIHRRGAPIQASPEALRSHPRAGRLIALVEALGVQPLFERSFKVSEGAVSTDRFLLGLPKREIEPDSASKLLDICRRLDGPKLYQDAIEEELPDSDFIHFGFEETGRECLYKVYLEFSTRLERMAENDPQGLISMMQGPDPFLMFLGFKWDPERPESRALTKYSWYPGLSLEGMLSRASDILAGEKRGTAHRSLEDLLGRVSDRVGYDQINFFEVLEEGSGRRSFDVNVYDAKLRMEDIQDLLFRAGRSFGLPEETLVSLMDRIQNENLGHLSGGMDRDGKEFLTFYHGGGRLQKQEPWVEGDVSGRA